MSYYNQLEVIIHFQASRIIMRKIKDNVKKITEFNINEVLYSGKIMTIIMIQTYI